MVETRILLSALWIALMFVYLLGDVLRIFAGHFTPGEIDGQKVPQAGYFGMAIFMLIPITKVRT